MKPFTENFEDSDIWEPLPLQMAENEVLLFLQKNTIDWRYVETLKKRTDFNDDVIGEWLNVGRKTFRLYRQTENEFKINMQEHILLLLVLSKRGIQFFGSPKGFDRWLNTENFFFDRQKPTLCLTTISGINFVNDRLTAMEFGDNV